MSNSLFGNPKIALGFAGGVVAIALVASVALNEYAPGAEPAPEPAVAAAAAVPAPAAPPASQGIAQGDTSGWGDAGSGWGAAPQPQAASAKQPGFDGPSAADPFADLGAMDNSATRNAGGRGGDRASGGPTITSRAAPGAPAVEPPGGESQGIIDVAGG